MLAYLFVVFAVVARMPFMPHPWNFTPVAAALLYFGARGSRRQMWVPFALLAASDVILTKFVYSYPLTWDQLVVWAWYAAILLLGTRLSESANWLRIGGAALVTKMKGDQPDVVFIPWQLAPQTFQEINLGESIVFRPGEESHSVGITYEGQPPPSVKGL